LAREINPLNAKLSPICHLLALLGAHHIVHVSRIRVKRKHKKASMRMVAVSVKTRTGHIPYASAEILPPGPTFSFRFI
jgi:hypothetical protein